MPLASPVNLEEEDLPDAPGPKEESSAVDIEPSDDSEEVFKLADSLREATSPTKDAPGLE